jgi:uncharacterized protein YyaL (SSP411 family)
MRSTTCLASLLVLASTTFGCRQSTAPSEKPAIPPAAASTQPAAAPPQPNTAAIDSSISANVGDPAKVREILSTLQQSVQKHDAAAVAAIVSYPITINPHKPNAVIIRTPKSFVDRYDRIITPHIADVIENQKYEALFVNDQGAMLGDGEVWIAGICRDKTCQQTDIKIRTIQNTTGNPK